MADDRPPRTVEFMPMLGETARRRADLHKALVELERVGSSPASGREADWAGGVVQALRELEREVEIHIDSNERSGGLYDEITETAPRLANVVHQLKDEHPVMRERTRALIDRLESPPSAESWTVDEVRDELQRLLGFMIKHRQRGSDLVWEAYTLDIGGIG